MPKFEVNGSVQFCLTVMANDQQEAEDMAVAQVTTPEGMVEATIDWTEQTSAGICPACHTACSGCVDEVESNVSMEEPDGERLVRGHLRLSNQGAIPADEADGLGG